MRRARLHADQRTIEAQERNRYLPTSLDAEGIQRILAPRVTVETGWEYLRSAVSASQLTPALDMPAIGRLGCGLVIPTDSAVDAVRILDSEDATTVSLVGVYTAEGADALITAAMAGGGNNDVAPVWASLQHGLIDENAAIAAVRLLKERAEAASQEDRELASQRQADDTLRRDLRAFLADCPQGHLPHLEDELRHLDDELGRIEGEQEALKQELGNLDTEESQDQAESERINRQLQSLSVTIAWLDELIPAAAQEAEWRAWLASAQQRSSEASARAEQHDSRQVTAITAAQGAKASAGAERDKAQRYRAEAAAIPSDTTTPEDGQEAMADPVVPLDALRRSHENARLALQARAAQSVLADRVERLKEQVAEARARLVGRPAAVLQAARTLLGTPDGQEPRLRDAALETAQPASTLPPQRLARLARQSPSARTRSRPLNDQAATPGGRCPKFPSPRARPTNWPASRRAWPPRPTPRSTRPTT